ncbi:MAG: hypothetical protein U1F23_03760 [Lysobacterales bacterium]
MPPEVAANAGADSVASTGATSPGRFRRLLLRAIQAPPRRRVHLPPAATVRSSAANPGLTVHVSLAPSLARDVTPGAILFVYARAVSGPPMPLAIKRLEASDLPATVTLADADGVMPTMRLSSAHQIVVAARVSASGNAMPQSGDLEGESAPIDLPHGAAVDVTIARAVP